VGRNHKTILVRRAWPSDCRAHRATGTAVSPRRRASDIPAAIMLRVRIVHEPG
jgi:hypothetical protein